MNRWVRERPHWRRLEYVSAPRNRRRYVAREMFTGHHMQDGRRNPVSSGPWEHLEGDFSALSMIPSLSNQSSALYEPSEGRKYSLHDRCTGFKFRHNSQDLVITVVIKKGV